MDSWEGKETAQEPSQWSTCHDALHEVPAGPAVARKSGEGGKTGGSRAGILSTSRKVTRGKK